MKLLRTFKVRFEPKHIPDLLIMYLPGCYLMSSTKAAAAVLQSKLWSRADQATILWNNLLKEIRLASAFKSSFETLLLWVRDINEKHLQNTEQLPFPKEREVHQELNKLSVATEWKWVLTTACSTFCVAIFLLKMICVGLSNYLFTMGLTPTWNDSMPLKYR